MTRNLLASSLVLSTFLMFSCRSSDKGDAAGSEVKADGEASAGDDDEPEKDAAKPGDAPGDAPVVDAAKPKPKGECDAKPEPTVCCEALTPSCNECRDQAKQTLETWQAKCLKPAEPPKDCKAGPPVSDCCADDSEVCRQCREAAIAVMVEWKERCSDVEAYSCDKQPPMAMCCQAMIPSCTACQDRNRRLQEDWERRCQ